MKKKLGIIMCICLMATISMYGGRRNVYAEEIDGENSEIIELTPEEVDGVLTEDSESGISLFATGLSTCTVAVSGSGGYIKVAFQTSSTSKASKIGVKSLKLQKYGTAWSTIYPLNGSYSYSKANTTVCKGGFKIAKKAASKKYRVTSTHYATIKGNTYSKNKTSSTVTY